MEEFSSLFMLFREMACYLPYITINYFTPFHFNFGEILYRMSEKKDLHCF
uniref:Uncharacterized protein n=1 Tax=Arundo donax TaxID=35708 RepID=A0A0A9DZB4_ARUDO